MKFLLKYFDFKDVGDIMQKVGDSKRIKSFLISSTMTLTINLSSIKIIARASGKLKELKVEDNYRVKAGEYLGILNSSAKTT